MSRVGSMGVQPTSMKVQPKAQAASSCLACRHFSHAPRDIEAALPGLITLSSAYAAVRASDGICAVHDRYVAASSVCASFA
jgi:hypothetical protein